MPMPNLVEIDSYLDIAPYTYIFYPIETARYYQLSMDHMCCDLLNTNLELIRTFGRRRYETFLK